MNDKKKIAGATNVRAQSNAFVCVSNIRKCKLHLFVLYIASRTAKNETRLTPTTMFLRLYRQILGSETWPATIIPSFLPIKTLSNFWATKELYNWGSGWIDWAPNCLQNNCVWSLLIILPVSSWNNTISRCFKLLLWSSFDIIGMYLLKIFSYGFCKTFQMFFVRLLDRSYE